MIIGMEKSRKIRENCNVDLENTDALITHAFVFLQFMTQGI